MAPIPCPFLSLCPLQLYGLGAFWQQLLGDPKPLATGAVHISRDRPQADARFLSEANFPHHFLPTWVLPKQPAAWIRPKWGTDVLWLFFKTRQNICCGAWVGRWYLKNLEGRRQTMPAKRQSFSTIAVWAGEWVYSKSVFCDVRFSVFGRAFGPLKLALMYCWTAWATSFEV